MGNSITRQRYLFMATTADKFSVMIYLIKKQKTWELERYLKYQTPRDSKMLANLKDENGVSLLMHAVFYSITINL